MNRRTLTLTSRPLNDRFMLPMFLFCEFSTAWYTNGHSHDWEKRTSTMCHRMLLPLTLSKGINNKRAALWKVWVRDTCILIVTNGKMYVQVRVKTTGPMLQLRDKSVDLLARPRLLNRKYQTQDSTSPAIQWIWEVYSKRFLSRFTLYFIAPAVHACSWSRSFNWTSNDTGGLSLSITE